MDGGGGGGGATTFTFPFFGGRPFFLGTMVGSGRGGLFIENVDVDVELDRWDAMGVPGELERELGVDCVSPNEAIEESRSLDGTLDCDPVEGIAKVYDGRGVRMCKQHHE